MCSSDLDLKRIEAVIKVAGAGKNVAVDANGRFDLKTAIAYARALEPYGLFWYEEAGDPLDFQLQAELALPATDGELALVHTPAYIDAVQHGTLSAAAQREIGFPWSTGMVERARRSSGATIRASRTSTVEGVSANLAGGTHHAYRDKGSGFCVFNDVAVATRLMQTEWARMQARARSDRKSTRLNSSHT